MTARTLTLQLAFPLEWEGQTINEVKIQRPKAKHLEALARFAIEEDADEATKARVALGTLSVLSDLPEGAAGELEIEDFQMLSEAMADFFPQATA